MALTDELIAKAKADYSSQALLRYELLKLAGNLAYELANECLHPDEIGDALFDLAEACKPRTDLKE